MRTGCRDQNGNCGSWAEAGECTRNPGFMSGKCPLACKICEPAPLEAAQYRGMHLVLSTQYGTVRLAPRWDHAPVTAALVVELAASTASSAEEGSAGGSDAGGGKGGAHCQGCEFYRNEDIPKDGSSGPPYALLQGSMGGLMRVPPHEGSTAMRRGHVAMVTDTKEWFISLADHPGWGETMTVWGEVDEADLNSTVAAIIAQPFSELKHPTYGTVMRLLAERVPFGLTALRAAEAEHTLEL